MSAGRGALLALLLFVVAGCGLGPSSDVKDIDPLTLPPRLVATGQPSPSNVPVEVDSGSGVYFLSDPVLRLTTRTVAAAPGVPALQELLNNLAAGPDASDRERGLSTALPPTTRLTVTSLKDDLATVDLSFGQVPPDQTTAIAQIVLTATSLPEIGRLLLTIDGEALQAPLASGAQTDRPLTRADYVSLVRGE